MPLPAPRRSPKQIGPARALAIASLALGCRQILGSDAYQFAEPSSDASIDAPADGPAGATCKPATVPPPNLTTEVGGARELVFVVRSIDLGEGTEADGSPAYLKLGLDQDGACRTDGGPPGCTNPTPAPSILSDGIEGRDDGLGRMIGDIKMHFGQDVIKSSIVNDDVAAGNVAPQALFRIRGYDGLQDDNHVDVDWFLPLTLVPTGDPGDADGAGADANVHGGIPKWDERDAWPVLPETFVPIGAEDAGAPLIPRSSTEAYVSNYRLVAKFPENIPFRFWYFVAPLRSPTLTADLFPDTLNHRFLLQHGMISGVALMTDFLAQIPIMTIQLPLGMPLCKDDLLYPPIHEWMCSFSDATSQSAPGTLCDSISVGYAFDAAPATVGTTVHPSPAAPLCPEGKDPGQDPCFRTDER